MISTNIRELLREQSLPQAAAAKAIGMAERTFVRKLAHPDLWTIGDIDRLAALCHVTRSAITG